MIPAKDMPRACWLCGRNGASDPLDAHHIFGGANRKLSEKYGRWCLCVIPAAMSWESRRYTGTKKR